MNANQLLTPTMIASSNQQIITAELEQLWRELTVLVNAEMKLRGWNDPQYNQETLRDTYSIVFITQPDAVNFTKQEWVNAIADENHEMFLAMCNGEYSRIVGPKASATINNPLKPKS